MSTSEKPYITPREVLSDLEHEVGHYSVEKQPWMRAALRAVPGYWNAAVAEQPQDRLWYGKMSQQLVRHALGYLSTKEVRSSMDQMLYSSVRQNLINLGNKYLVDDEPTTRTS